MSTERKLKIASTVVLSLSENPTSQLMWAYYADAHTGLAIGFDPSRGIFAGPSPHRTDVRPVIYTPDRPSAPTGDDLTDDEVLMTKSSEWLHEQEWRCVDSLYSADGEPVDGRYPFALNPESVSEVIVGCRSDYDLDRRVIQVLREPRYRHVRLFRACPDSRHYRLNREEMSREDW